MTTCTGGCHCGAVRFEADVDFGRLMTCNCSHCAKKGFILGFVPAAGFTLLKGEDTQTEYRFNKKVVQHLFCPVCGVQSFARGRMPDGSEIVSVNVRCLDDVDLDALTPAAFDGRSL